LSVTLTKTSAVGATTPVTFHVKVTNEVGATLLDTTSSNIEFNQLDGTPIANFNTLDVPLSGTQTISLNFGAVGTTSGVRITAGATTSLAGQVVDGHPELGLNSLSWDEKGILQFVYSASEKVAGPQLALASFTNQDALEMIGGRLFTGGTAADRTIGRPDSGVFGKIVGGSLELANVDLTQEFADMIIIQRGYQASSRVMTVSNQMIEELYNSGRGG
jgi:flagellar hook protein FlgE